MADEAKQLWDVEIYFRAKATISVEAADKDLAREAASKAVSLEDATDWDIDRFGKVTPVDY